MIFTAMKTRNQTKRENAQKKVTNKKTLFETQYHHIKVEKSKRSLVRSACFHLDEKKALHVIADGLYQLSPNTWDYLEKMYTKEYWKSTSAPKWMKQFINFSKKTKYNEKYRKFMKYYLKGYQTGTLKGDYELLEIASDIYNVGFRVVDKNGKVLYETEIYELAEYQGIILKGDNEFFHPLLKIIN